MVLKSISLSCDSQDILPDPTPNSPGILVDFRSHNVFTCYNRDFLKKMKTSQKEIAVKVSQSANRDDTSDFS